MLRLLQDQVLIAVRQERQIGSIQFLTNQSNQEGVVLAVGAGKKTPEGLVIDPLVSVGDKVIFGNEVIEVKVSRGDEVQTIAQGEKLVSQLDDQNLVISRESNIFGIME